jgi:hypothetical protein
MAKRLGLVLGIVGLMLSQATSADTAGDVKAVFERFIAAQNARDMETLKGLLLDTPNLLWVVASTPRWGRDAALQALNEQCQGAFYLDPGRADFRTVELGGDVVQLYVPAVLIPSPAPLRPPQQVQQMQPEKFIISQTMVKTSAGWRVATILSFPINSTPGRQPSC